MFPSLLEPSFAEIASDLTFHDDYQEDPGPEGLRHLSYLALEQASREG